MYMKILAAACLETAKKNGANAKLQVTHYQDAQAARDYARIAAAAGRRYLELKEMGA